MLSSLSRPNTSRSISHCGMGLASPSKGSGATPAGRGRSAAIASACNQPQDRRGQGPAVVSSASSWQVSLVPFVRRRCMVLRPSLGCRAMYLDSGYCMAVTSISNSRFSRHTSAMARMYGMGRSPHSWRKSCSTCSFLQ